MKLRFSLLLAGLLLGNVQAYGEGVVKKATQNKNIATKVKKHKKPKNNPLKDFHVADSTNIDFEAADIEGRMKAPMGFLLRGRNGNAMKNMVKLRTNFKQELEDSKAGVIAISPATP